MNKKILAIVMVIIILLGGGYFVMQNMTGSTSKTGGEIEITHDLGVTQVKQNPERIVVFDYGTLDTLDRLGAKITGVVKASLPSYLAKYEGSEYEDIGTLFEPNYETLAGLQPDVIFISGRQKDAYDALSEIAPTVYLTIDSQDYFGSLKENVATLAQIVGMEKAANTEIEQIEKDVEALNEETAKATPTALILLTNQGKISAYGQASRFGIIHNTFGVIPADEGIEESTHGQSVSFEYIVSKDPDYLFVVDRNKVVSGTDGASTFENDLMKHTKAYQNDNIIFLDPDVWYLSTGGLQSTEKMIAEIDAAIQ